MDADVNRRLEEINRRLNSMVESIEKIAVQNVRLGTLEKRMDGVWKRMDNEVLPLIHTCPRKQINKLFMLVIPLSLTQVGIALKLLGLI